MRAELSSLSGMVANLEIRMNKELDSAFAQIQTLGEEMGLAHSYPNTTELRATLTPAPERPAADTEPSPDGILLTDLKVQPTASGKHNNNILERPLRQTVSDLQLFFHQADENKDGSLSYQEIARVLKQQAPGEAELKVFDTNDDSLYSLAEIKRTQGRTE
ncbi:EF-hand calcium-binding domain-containing protein 14 [Amia ocellicauda]|uniref:EF-hand calcium-binding domain-containing protein 14 n=1 Tax=Amia ocellicauda TaxID=2972642 RepID=UPI003463E229